MLLTSTGALQRKNYLLRLILILPLKTACRVLYFLYGFIKGCCENEGRVPSKIDKMLHYLNDKSPF